MTDPSRFGVYGGRFVPETLMAALDELEHAFRTIVPKEEFQDEMRYYLHEYAGRKTPLTFCRNVSRDFGCRVYLKREDLLHSGAHKLNNALGQALLARFMGKRRLIAETGAGQHGVATAIAGAVLGMQVVVYMGDEDIERQALNVVRMKMLGAQVTPVSSGSRTLKDAINEALRDWVANVETTHYLIGSVVGPHPFPTMVRDFQTVIGNETREQIMEKEGRLPDAIVACVGGVRTQLVSSPRSSTKRRVFTVRKRVGKGRRAGTGRLSAGVGRAFSMELTPTSSRTRSARSSSRTASRQGSTTRGWARSTVTCGIAAG